MKAENKRYIKDFLKNKVYSLIKKRAPKFQTPMQQVIMQLEIKGLMPEKINAVELFGMHGFWHTLDYIDCVEHLDFFEINERYLNLSKKTLSKYPVDYFCQDSIAYIGKTSKKYNFVVSDSPGSGFYDENGIPYFMPDLLKITDRDGILIFNLLSAHLKNYKTIEQELMNKYPSIESIFWVTRNNLVTYGVIKTIVN